MDELLPRNIITSNKPLALGNTAATNSPVKNSAPQQTATALSTNPSSNIPDNAVALRSLIQALKNQPSMAAEVKTSQALTQSQQQVFFKANPSLATKTQVPANTSTSTATPSTSLSTLYLVKLFQPASSQHLLTTVTPVAFKTGDTIQLQLNHQQQIVIKPTVSSVRPAIIEGLAKALPAQQNISQLLNTSQSLQKLPNPIQNHFLDKPVLNNLKLLNQFIKTDTSLASATQVKNTLSNSGLLAENKIQAQQSLIGDLRTALGQLQKTVSSDNQSSTVFSQLANHRSIDTLLSLLLSHINTLPTSAKGSSENVNQNIHSILQLLGLKPSNNNQVSETKKVKDFINKQLNQLINNTQEKIHLNQLRSLIPDSSSSDNSATLRNAPFTTEIPLRWGEQVLPLQLSIKENTEEEKESSPNEQSSNDDKITRRWTVFLSFDLPSTNKSKASEAIEQLHSQLIIIEDSISVTLWTESKALCEHAKHQLTHLRNSLTAKGLNVDDLTCIEGKPPTQDLSLNYNLVDIVT